MYWHGGLAGTADRAGPLNRFYRGKMTLGLPPHVARGVMDLLYDLPSLWMVLDLLSLGMVMEPGQPAVPVQAARYLGR